MLPCAPFSLPALVGSVLERSLAARRCHLAGWAWLPTFGAIPPTAQPAAAPILARSRLAAVATRPHAASPPRPVAGPRPGHLAVCPGRAAILLAGAAVLPGTSSAPSRPAVPPPGPAARSDSGRARSAS